MNVKLGRIIGGDLNFDGSDLWRRFFFIYETESDLPRGGHAHKACIQALLCVQGEVTIRAFDGYERAKVILSGSDDLYLLVNPGIWLDIEFKLNDTRLLVLASHQYDEDDYLRTKDDYILWLSSMI